MTNELKLRHILISSALKYLDWSEAKGQDDLIIDKYNAIRTPRYKMNHQDSWCAAFVSVVKHEAGFDQLIPTECGCEEMIRLFMAIGRWQEDGNYTPQIADIIFYNWNDNTQPNNGWSDHVGIVTGVSGQMLKAIEGNSSDRVKFRDIAIGNGNIRGYGLPNFASISVEEPSVPTPAPIPIKPTSDIIKNANVGAWQKAVNKGFELKGNDKLAVDNSFGPASQSFANDNQLHRNIKNRYTIVLWLQKRLNALGFYNGLLDGKFEGGTEDATKRFQTSRGLKSDGWVGTETVRQLLK